MRDLSWPLRLLLVNQLGVNLGFFMLVPYLATHLSGGLGLSAAVVGVVLGVRNLSQQGLAIVGGAAADRFGARGLIIAGCGLRSAGFGLFAVAESAPPLLAAAVLSGLAGALFTPAVRAYVAAEAADRVRAFALFTVFAQAGALVGPVLGSVLLLLDFRVVAVVAALVFAALTAAQALALPARAVTAGGGPIADRLRAGLRDRSFLAFAGAASGMYVLQSQLYLVLPMEADRQSGHPAAVAAIFLVSTVATLLLQVPLTRLFEGRGAAVPIGLAVMGLGFAPLVVTRPAEPGPAGPVAVLVATLALAAGVAIAQPFVLALIPAFAPDGLAGTYFGLFSLVSGVAAAAGNALIGWSGAAGPLVCVAVGLLCALLSTRLSTRWKGTTR
ncbi:MFS transporter [Nonomuraea muscovyensis]|uniref:MFS transporter n=1 Tax=Nonomuraea muscovyensis TaxID=1124761 RepID=UPI0033E24571